MTDIMRSFERRAAAAVLAVGCLFGTPAVGDEYPPCTREDLFPWPDRCIIGGYRHSGDIFYSRVVHRQGPVFALARGTKVTDIAFPLEDYFEKARTTGILVLKDGKVVFERYRLGADETSLFTTQSVAKSFVSTLVAFAIGDGLIGGVDDPITQYLPELKDSGYDGVPIKAALQMSSGAGHFQSRDYFEESIRTNKVPLAAYIGSTVKLCQPYDCTVYADVEAVMLGSLVARVARKPLSDYLSEKLWGPLGMESDANWVTDGSGPEAQEAGAIGLSATLRDYARFGLFMAQDGVWQGRRLLPSNWVQEATRTNRQALEAGRFDSVIPLGYQYFWWTFPGDDRAFTAIGFRGQFIYVNPAQRIVIVLTSVWHSGADSALHRQTYALFDAFVAALRN